MADKADKTDDVEKQLYEQACSGVITMYQTASPNTEDRDILAREVAKAAAELIHKSRIELRRDMHKLVSDLTNEPIRADYNPPLPGKLSELALSNEISTIIIGYFFLKDQRDKAKAKAQEGAKEVQEQQNKKRKFEEDDETAVNQGAKSIKQERDM